MPSVIPICCWSVPRPRSQPSNSGSSSVTLPHKSRACSHSMPARSGLKRPLPNQRPLMPDVKSKPPMSNGLWRLPAQHASTNCASRSCPSRNVHVVRLNSPFAAPARRDRSSRITVSIVCRCNSEFAVGRAAVKPACRFSAGPWAEAKIRIPLIPPVQHPAGSSHSGGVLPSSNQRHRFLSGSPSEINRDVRPAFSAGRSALPSPTGILASAYTNLYPYPGFFVLAAVWKTECENLRGNYRGNNEVIYRGALQLGKGKTGSFADPASVPAPGTALELLLSRALSSAQAEGIVAKEEERKQRSKCVRRPASGRSSAQEYGQPFNGATLDPEGSAQ